MTILFALWRAHGVTWRVNSREMMLGAGVPDGRLGSGPEPSSSPTCTTVASLLCHVPTLGNRGHFSSKMN